MSSNVQEKKKVYGLSVYGAHVHALAVCSVTHDCKETAVITVVSR